MGETRAAVVTGGGQGIGRATAEHLLRAGYAVALAEIDEEAGRETERELSAAGPVCFLRTDVAREGDVQAAVAAALERFGRLDVVVNNAAIAAGGPVTDLALESWNRVLAVNLTGPFLFAKHAAPALRLTRGAIVNIASTRALMSEPGTEAYAASKGGVAALTHALAVSLGPEVRVNSISPGWIDVTPWRKTSARQPAVLSPQDHAQHPAGRVGTPADIARMVVFLADPGNGFITGQNVVIDGGMTRKMIYV